MVRTIDEILQLMDKDLDELPNVTDYDKGFRAGIAHAIFIIRISTEAAKEAAEHE